jgi:putative alpha-1,2-mannosidase
VVRDTLERHRKRSQRSSSFEARIDVYAKDLTAVEITHERQIAETSLQTQIRLISHDNPTGSFWPGQLEQVRVHRQRMTTVRRWYKPLSRSNQKPMTPQDLEQAITSNTQWF